MNLHQLPELISFLNALPEPHLLFDRQFQVLAANAAYRRNFGENQTFVGRTCYDISHHTSAPCDQMGEICPVQRCLVSEQRERVLHLHHTPQGDAYVHIELFPIRDGKGDIAFFIEKMEPVDVARGTVDIKGLVGRDPTFQRMLDMATRVATSEANVLLLGESGSGKELLAYAIHESSNRVDKPFVALDCSGLSETLFESELFGYERGAFTGATSRRIGLIESACGGTLFLDEVGDIPLAMQVKLLRLLENGTYRRVGSVDLLKSNIRLVSATHRDLFAMVQHGSFRQDLYFRLSTFPIELPPLRKRLSDIPILVESLLARICPDRNLKISAEATDLLLQYDFPGNIRELRNIIERASLLCDGDVILPTHLPENLNCVEAKCEIQAQTLSLSELNRQTLENRLAQHRGNRKSLAQELGISESTLYRRLKAQNSSISK